jgi:surface protein
MATTSQYLEQLQQDRNDFADALVDRGVSAAKTETFTSLVGKIKDIKPKLQNKTVAPKEDGLTISSDSNYDGLNEVTISPIQAGAIRNLTAGNIKKNVEILDIVGTYGATSQIKYAEPSQEQQIIKPDNGIEFLSQVTILPVTSGIDADIIPSNIRKGKNILGVEGNFEGDFNFQTKSVFANAEEDIIVTPDYGYDAMESVTIKKVTSSIDSEIRPENIRKDVNILGVTGVYAPSPAMTDKYISAATYERTVYPDEGYGYFEKVTIAPVTNAIDSDIKASNIREGITILGVEGNLEPVYGQEVYINPTKETQIIIPDSEAGKNAITKATVNPVTSAIDANIVNTNIKKGVSILGVEGSYEGTSNLQTKTVTPTGEEQQVIADTGYDALSSVTVKATPIEDITVDPSMETKTYSRSDGAFINSVTVNQVSSDIDANIQPENIKQNMSILGVVGTYKGEQQNYFASLNKTGAYSEAGIAQAILDIPSDLVITVGKYQFVKCKGLQKIPALDYSNLTDCERMFAECSGISDASNAVNFKKITNATNMFASCTKMKTIDLSSWNIGKLTNCLNMFYCCLAMTTVNLNNWVKTGNINTSQMFYTCRSLTTIIADNTEIHTTSTSQMFSSCESLVNADLSWLHMTGNSSVASMFNLCSSLQKVDIRNIKLSEITTSSNWSNFLRSVPTSCMFIVGTDADKTWMATNFSSYTNVKTVAEYEAELGEVSE